MANALLFVDGFDHETNGFGNADLLTKWTAWSGGVSGSPFGIDNTSHAFNGASLQGNPAPGGNNGQLYKSLAGAPFTELIAGFAFNPVANANVEWGFSFDAAPAFGAHRNFFVNYNGANTAIDVYDSTGVKVGSTANGSVPVGNYTYLEFDVVFNNVAGTIKVYLNGAIAINLVAQNTGANGNSVSSFYMVQNNNNGGSHWDDLYVMNPVGALAPYNAALGGCRVQTLYPTANDAVQWTPNAGTNFSEVNAVQFNNGATFNSAGTVGFQDTLDNNALYSNPVSIFGVAVTGAYAQDTGGGGVAVENVIISGVTTALGTPTPVPAGANTYAYDQDIFQADPATAAAWLAASVNAVKIGYNRTA